MKNNLQYTVKIILSFALLISSISCFSQVIISKQNAVDDIDTYVNTIHASHFDPFMYITKDKYLKEIRSIKASIGDSIDVKQFVNVLYQVTSLLNDGHSTPSISQPIFKDDYKKDLFLPVEFVVEKDKLYSSSKTFRACGIPAGAEILSINEKEVSPLLVQVQKHIAGLQPFSEVMSGKLLSYFLFLADVKAPFVLSYKDLKGKSKKVRIEKAVSFREALAVTMPHISKRFDYKILGNKLGYMDIRSLGGDMNDFKLFLDSCFADLKRNHITSLAIDLRKNSGGNTEFGDLLFSYLTHKEYFWGIKKWKVSQPYKDHLKANGDTASSYFRKTNGTIIIDPESCKPQKNPFWTNDLFKGDVYLLTGPFTFSSAMALSDVAKTYKIATLIGAPTGENTKDFGEAFTFDLPNSKIRIQTTSSFTLGANCNKKGNSPVIPDVRIQTTHEDQIYERDPLINYLLLRIKQNSGR